MGFIDQLGHILCDDFHLRRQVVDEGAHTNDYGLVEIHIGCLVRQFLPIRLLPHFEIGKERLLSEFTWVLFWLRKD